MARDLACALGLLCIAAIYYVLASGIGRSALSDEVGPSGLPIAYAAMLAAIASALGAKAAFQILTRRARSADANARGSDLTHQVRRALGALAIGLSYLLIVPFVGYLLALTLVMAAMVVYQGERPTPRVAMVTAGGATAFWLLFDRLLGIPMPGLWGL